MDTGIGRIRRRSSHSRSRSPRRRRRSSSPTRNLLMAVGPVSYLEYLALQTKEKGWNQVSVQQRMEIAKEFRESRIELMRKGAPGGDGEFFMEHKEEEWYEIFN